MINIHALVREVLRESQSTNPRELAAQVFAKVDPKEWGTALEQLLVDTVRLEISRERMRGVAQAENGVVRGGGNVGRSRIALARQGWRKQLEDRIHAGAEKYVFLRDADRKDLLFAQQELRRQAAACTTKANLYADLVDAMVVHNVDRVGAIPESVLCVLLGG